MNIRLRLLVSLPLYIFTALAFAHPGPHSHAGVANDAWHAFFGWEFWLVVCTLGALGYLIHRLRNTRTQ